MQVMSNRQFSNRIHLVITPLSKTNNKQAIWSATILRLTGVDLLAG